MKGTVLLTIVMLFCCTLRAQTVDAINATQMDLHYETGVVKIANGIAQLNIPPGFKFLNAEKSKYIINELWHKSPQPDLAGMLFPEWGGPGVKGSYAVVINYEARGFVKDEDAHKIDYRQVLTNLQRDEVVDNAERKSMGYTPVHLIRWAQQPVYDKTRNELYWAKELQEGNSNEHKLSYNLRVLGRQGILSMNAESSMQNTFLKNDFNKLLHIASFTVGNRHADFEAKTDKVAAWTIGTLVSGKILSKSSSVFAVLGKYLNLIVSGLAVVIILISNILRPAAYCKLTCKMALTSKQVSA
jgi:uncharacterized membrane-anchored protein